MLWHSALCEHTVLPFRYKREGPRFCSGMVEQCVRTRQNATKVMKRLLQIEQNIKCVFRKALKEQYVSITLDHWTSNANINYIAQTAHFITEEWKLTSFTLACSLHKGGSAGVNTREVSLLKHHHLLVSKLIYFSLLLRRMREYAKTMIFHSTMLPLSLRTLQKI